MPIPATGPSVLLVAALLLAASPVEPQQVTPKEVLVRWRAGASRVSGSGVSAIDSLHRAYRLRSERPLFPAPAPVRRAARSPELALGRWSMLRFEADVPAQEIARQYLRLPAIEAAQPNFLRRVTQARGGDPLRDDQWALQAIGWTAADPGSAQGVLVAVVDSGIDIVHPDLRAQIWRNLSEEGGEPGVDDDGNGYTDDIIGWDFSDAPGLAGEGDYLVRDADPDDESGHGTHVAGIIAATVGNGEGIAGVAPGVELMALRAGFNISGAGYLQDDDVAAAMVYAVDQGADVINLSLGDPAYSPLMEDVVGFASLHQVVVVAAAGNEGSSDVFYPARHPQAIAVAAAGRGGEAAGFSNFGAAIDLTAPGLAVLSTQAGGGYAELSGTSMAAPHVAGVAALIRQRHPGYSPLQVLGALSAAALDIGPRAGWDADTGHGLLQVPSASAPAPIAISFRAPTPGRRLSGSAIPIELDVVGVDDLDLTVEWGEGEDPGAWRSLAVRRWQSAAAAPPILWSPGSLAPGPVTLRASVRLGDRAHSRRVVVDWAPEGAVVTRLAVSRALQGRRWRDLVTWSTDRPSLGVLELTQAGERHLRMILPPDRVDQVALLPADLSPGAYEALVYTDAVAVAARDCVIVRPSSIDRSHPTFGSTLPAGYLMPQLTDFDADGVAEVAAMVYGEALGGYGATTFFAWPGSTPAHTTARLFIPWGVSDLDGDGRQELMAVDARRVRLLEPTGAAQFPSRVAWEMRDVWGGEVSDADGDGRPEMFLRSAAAELFRVFEARGDDDYVETAALVNDTPGENELGTRQVAADLDGDGRGDLFSGDSDGDLIVFEAAADDAYRPVWRAIEEEDFVDGRLVGGGADLDGDGDPEFIGGRLRRDPFDVEGRQWSLTVYGAAGDDDYDVEWRGQVLAGSSRGAGISMADLDGDGGLEWIVVVVPHLYVLCANDSTGGYEVIWHAEVRDTQRPAVGDADGDGRAELFYNDGGGSIRGVSWGLPHDTLDAPPGWQALAVGPDRVELRWEPVSGARHVEITRDGVVIAEAAATGAPAAFVDSQLVSGRAYAYRIAAVDSTGRRGPASPELIVEPMARPAIVAVERTSARQLTVAFDQRMAAAAARPHRWHLVPEVALVQAGLLDRSGRRLLLGFDRALPDSGLVELFASGVRSAHGGLVGEGAGSVPVRLRAVETPLRLLAAEIVDGRTIRLAFDRGVRLDRSAEAVVDGGRLLVDHLRVGADSRSLEVILSAATPLAATGRRYTVEVTGVLDGTGQPETVSASVTVPVTELDALLAYPNPFHPSTAEMTIAGLPPGAQVRVFSMAGDLVWSGREEDGDGGVSWTGQNEAGLTVAAGVYLIYAEHGGRARRLRVAVLPR